MQTYRQTYVKAYESLQLSDFSQIHKHTYLSELCLMRALESYINVIFTT